MKMNIPRIQQLIATYNDNQRIIDSKAHPSFIRFLNEYNTKIKYKLLLERGGKPSMV